MGSKFKNMGRFLDNPHRLKFTLQIIQPFSNDLVTSRKKIYIGIQDTEINQQAAEIHQRPDL